MSETGLYFDLPEGMKIVKCAINDIPRGNDDVLDTSLSGKFPALPENYPRHVLVVDDEPLIRWSVTESLSEMGLDVEEASCAASALRAVTTAALPFDAVVLDLRLPDMEDLSLLKTIRQLLPKAQLTLMTAFGTAEIIDEAEALGATVITKPFELDELKRQVIG